MQGVSDIASAVEQILREKQGKAENLALKAAFEAISRQQAYQSDNPEGMMPAARVYALILTDWQIGSALERVPEAHRQEAALKILEKARALVMRAHPALMHNIPILVYKEAREIAEGYA